MDAIVPEARRFAISARAIFDSLRGDWANETVVVVEDGTIIDLLTEVPTDCPIIDVGDAVLLPGLIDTHTHVLLQGVMDPHDLAIQMLEENTGHRVARAVRAMQIALMRGFTTIRDLGTEGAGFCDVGLREAAAEGVIPGPRMLVAGPAIRSTGRYPLPA